MLAPYRPQFIEKVLTDALGRQFRVVFAISFVDGEVSGRIVSATEVKALAPQTLCLPCATANKQYSTSNPLFSISVASPYFSLDYLINSQPTRAPSHN